MTEDLPKLRRLDRIADSFSPGSPIDRLDVLAGRGTEIATGVDAVSQRGRHIGLFGERGFGKTSLANALARVRSHRPGATVNCSAGDTYPTLWGNVFRELRIDPGRRPGPESVRRALAQLDPPPLIVIDELDRLQDDDGLSLMADTVKTLSDHAVPTTLALVGMRSSMERLMAGHPSIVQNLVQIEIPEMPRRDLRELVDRGCERAGLAIQEPAARRIASLSQGLPHFTHLLALHAARRTVQDDRSEITVDDVSAAISLAVNGHPLQSEYRRAIGGGRSSDPCPRVLLACALAERDQNDSFSAPAVCDSLALLTGKPATLSHVSWHLSQLCRPRRGRVLQRQGTHRLRFADPILRPYAILEGFARGLAAQRPTSFWDRLARL